MKCYFAVRGWPELAERRGHCCLSISFVQSRLTLIIALICMDRDTDISTDINHVMYARMLYVCT